MDRRIYLVAAAALIVIAGASVYVATKVKPADVGAQHTLAVEADAVPTVAAAKGWLNSPPLSGADLQGKVVLYDFWTYSCVNCQRTLPHLKALYDRYKGDGLQIIGVHSPEFDFEKDHDNIARAVQELGVTWPVAFDDDMAIWNSFGVNAWPTEYLTDKQGRLRSVLAGEGDYEDKENDVRTLLGIPAGASRAESAGPEPSFSAAITPEIHFGLQFGGDQFCSSPEGLSAQTSMYSLPSPVPQDSFALQGNWTVDDQGVTTRDASGALVLRFRGAEVNIVAGSTTAGTPVPVAVDVDGTPLAPLSVDAHDLYHVVEHGPDGYHTLTFRPGAAGFEAFAFTFGST
jgi:thiol-disulfide isomerase/thioredoxin